ncbi:MAG: hypothetical protein O7J95_00305, partial [Planctomycetota bacterium]|nr:hypothetical protein [Planctomycetota bacterium]
QNLCTWTFGEDTFDDPFMTTIGPGEYRIVLADDDGGERRIYHRVVDDGTGRLVVDTSRKFYSTRFRLQANRRRPDEFQLVADRVISIDLVRLDFSFFAEENGFDVTADNFLVDFSVGRFPDEEDEPYAPDALEPGIVTPCPTPGGPNSLVCDIDAPPTFDDVVSVFPRCPREDEPARVRTRVSIDSDAGDEFDLELIYRVDGGADVTLSRGDGVTVTLAPQGDQFDAVRGATLYEVEATVSPQPAGARVEFRLRAFDRFLDVETILGEENAPRLPGEEPRVSFTYLSGFTPDPLRVRINEVLPFNRATSVPPAPPATDFVELFLPADASAEYDLSGHFLAVERLSEEEGAPIRFPREWRFPDETRIRPGEHLVVFVEDLPEETPGYPQVDTFDLDDCRSTIYLIGPTETLANCILDSLSWRLACVEGGEPDRSVGRVCDGSEDFDFRRLHRPTPGTTNVELPFLHGVAHVPLLGGDVNECPAPGSQVELRVLFFVDRLLPDLFGNSEAIAGATIEMENGASFDIPAARISSRPRLPQNFLELYKPTIPPRCGRDEDRANSCFKAYRFFQFVPVPDEPIVRFRFTVTDACGNVLGPCREDEFCFEFATTLQDRPRSVRINEINRFFPLPGDVRQRPWIELYNDSEEEVDLSGMFLSNDPDLPRLAEIPPGTTIAAGGTLLLVTDGLPLPDDRLADEVIDLDWAQFESNDARRCRADGTLFLVDREDRGSCLLDSFPFCFSLTPEFCDPDTSCDGRSLGRLPDGAGRIALLPEPSPGAPNRAKTPEVFLRGDTDKDGRHNITDAVIILRHLFFGRAADCLDALDADDTGTLNITDAIFLLSYLFDSGAPAPPAPFDAPGADPTPDNLDCAVGLHSP